MVETKYLLFPECATCKLESIGACTISGDVKSCSNAAVNNNDTFIKFIKPNGEELKPGEIFCLTIKV